ncbi:hypothetical protein JCM10212_006809 [Sporobolomyces blumeae]
MDAAASARRDSWLGLAPHIRPVHVVASLTSTALSISFLVWISAATPFVLSSLVKVPPSTTGAVVGRLIVADEVTALVLYLPYGAMADRWGVKPVAFVGHSLCAVALFLYPQATRVWHLVLSRVVFAAGAGALVATLSAVLSSMTEVPPLPSSSSDPSPAVDPNRPPSERSRLLNESAISTASTVKEAPHRSGRLAGMTGFASGLGALLAVFGYLRLPNLFARWSAPTDPDSPAALARGLVVSFYVVAGIAVCEGIFALYGLPGRSGLPIEGGGTGRGVRKTIRRLAKRLLAGFVVAGKNGDVALGLLTSFATRAQAVIVTAVVPLLVNRYFLNNGLCSSTPDLLLADGPTKHSCRQAYILASILTGIVQLVTLVGSPLVGLLSASPTLSSLFRDPQAFVLASAFVVGTLSSAGFAALPGGDPRLSVVWLFAVGLGLTQAAGTVISLALMTKGRVAVVAKEGKEVGGALSSSYSLCGGLGILIVGSSGGALFDTWGPAPFVLLAGVNAIVVVAAFVVWVRSPT